MKLWVALSAGGSGLLAVAYVLDPRRAAFALLAAFVWLASVLVGAVVFLAIAHTTGSAWMVVVRRRAEDVVATLPLLVPLFGIVLLVHGRVFPWASSPESWTDAVRHAIRVKHGYLASGPFALRSFACIACWIAAGEALRRRSLRQDATGDLRLVRAQRQIAAGALPLLAVTLTVATFDWVMSIDPTWSSTVLGIYLYAGAFGGAIGLVAILALAPRAADTPGASRHHGHALGRLLFTFVVFWGYIAFAQYLLIWIADVPREVPWVIRRTTGSWGGVAIVLAATHFVLPFLLFLSRSLKLAPRAVLGLGVWLLAAHALDVVWLILPELGPSALPSWQDLSAFAFVGGVTVLLGTWRARGEAYLPLRDPRLARGLRYEATP